MKEQNNVRCPNCGVSDVTYNIEKKKLAKAAKK